MANGIPAAQKGRVRDPKHNSYQFASTEQTERISRPIYNVVSALAVDILSETTTLTMRDSIDGFPTSGFLKIDSEFMSYSGKNNATKQFTGVVRGEYGSTPDSHTMNTDATLAERVVDNPLNILLKLLTSKSGSGSYDTLDDGLAISPSLIDVTTIESIRDDFFFGTEFSLVMSGVGDALKFIEDQILFPNGLRFHYSSASKLSVVLLNRSIFIDESQDISEDTITSYPKWSVDGNRVTNRISIQWDYNPVTNQYLRLTTAQDDDSISTYGLTDILSYSFQGITEALDGETIVDKFAQRILARLSLPTPEISLNTQIDKSLSTIGDKSRLLSSQIPSPEGDLNFANELEIVSRSINFLTGDVQFKLAYTSFTTIRQCFLAPSDVMTVITSQSIINVPAGRGTMWGIGWKVRLWNIVAGGYSPDPVNTILSIAGDVVTFTTAWATVLTANNFRLKFANYDEVIESQKRYCFLSVDNTNFNDGKSPYKVTY